MNVGMRNTALGDQGLTDGDWGHRHWFLDLFEVARARPDDRLQLERETRPAE